LKGVETLTGRTVLGALLIVLGGISSRR